MVYSRDTTSAMAERVEGFLGVFGLVLGVVFGVGIFADAVAYSMCKYLVGMQARK